MALMERNFPQILSKPSLKPECKGNPPACPPGQAEGQGAGAERWVGDKAGTPAPQEVTPWPRGKGLLSSLAVPGHRHRQRRGKMPHSNQWHGTAWKGRQKPTTAWRDADPSGSRPATRATLKNIPEKIRLACTFFHFQKKGKIKRFFFSFFLPFLLLHPLLPMSREHLGGPHLLPGRAAPSLPSNWFCPPATGMPSPGMPSDAGAAAVVASS